MTQPNAKIRDLISSLHSKSTALNKLLPVKICGFTVLGLVDSGNSFYNAISLAVANKIGLSNFNHYTGPPVGTALNWLHSRHCGYRRQYHFWSHRRIRTATLNLIQTGHRQTIVLWT